MKKSKDKRIKKIKRYRIWPFVLGLGLIVLLFVFVTSFAVYLSYDNAVNEKLRKGIQVKDGVLELCASQEDKYDDALYQEFENVVNYLDEVEGICILDGNGQGIWSSGAGYPDILNRVRFVDQYGSSDYIDLVIVEDPYGIFNDDGTGILVGVNDTGMDNFDTMIAPLEEMTSLSNQVIMNSKIWLLRDVSDGYVCVLYDLRIYTSDAMYILLLVLLVLALIGIFVLYYLATLIGVVMNQRRVTKVLYMDMITGGNNWIYFVKKGTRLLKHNFGNRKKYAMVHLRMRKYRSFCTCFGVRDGEELLERFYKVLKKQIKMKEAMAHHEMSDFGLLLCYTDEEQLLKRLEDMELKLNALVPNMKLYFDFGVCLIEAKEKDVDMLYNNACTARGMLADDAEYRVAFFDVEMKKQQMWERKVEDEMEHAIVNREFKVYLQPKYSAKEEEIAGAEALVRWIHPEEGFIPPNRFIPIFEKNGFIIQLDDYMLEEVARQQAKWIEEGMKVVPISVNVSRAHFTREDLAEHICEIVDRYKVPHDVIELELTESAFFDDKQVLLGTVKKLRDHGFIVSMDDFGAGYSSLNSLKELHIDVLKIDADFFRGVDSVERGMLIVSEVIDLAKKLDMKIVAEGIESRDQVEFLAGQECDLIQGYYFAKPMPIEEFEEKYKA